MNVQINMKKKKMIHGQQTAASVTDNKLNVLYI